MLPAFEHSTICVDEEEQLTQGSTFCMSYVLMAVLYVVAMHLEWLVSDQTNFLFEKCQESLCCYIQHSLDRMAYKWDAATLY